MPIGWPPGVNNLPGGTGQYHNWRRKMQAP